MTATPADATPSDAAAPVPAPTPGPAPSTRFDPSAPVPEEYDVFCHRCGYSLVGLVGYRCPECGAAFDANELPYARVPWLHRRRIGRLTGYWQTMWQVVLRPRAFAEELCRPVRISADDAHRFRKATIYFAASAGLAMVVGLVWVKGDLVPMWRDVRARVDFLLLSAIGWGAAVMFMRLATDMPLFIWKGHPLLPPHELAPVQHYAAAPLALTPAVFLLALVLPGLAWSLRGGREWANLSAAGAAIALAAWVAVAWRTPLVLMKAATGCGPDRVLLLALYLPLHCLIMAVLTVLVAVPVLLVLSEGWRLILKG